MRFSISVVLLSVFNLKNVSYIKHSQSKAYLICARKLNTSATFNSGLALIGSKVSNNWNFISAGCYEDIAGSNI